MSPLIRFLNRNPLLAGVAAGLAIEAAAVAAAFVAWHAWGAIGP